MNSIDHVFGAQEDACANSREDGEEYFHGPFVGEVVCNFDFEGVEGVGGGGESGAVEGLHD